jgi:hypothetical protein
MFYTTCCVLSLSGIPQIDFGDGHHEIFSYCGGGLTSSPEVAVIVTAQESLAPIS